MAHKKTPDFYHTNEFKRQTQCPYTGEAFRTCPHIYKMDRIKFCCGFRTTAETQEGRIEQIKTHISGGSNCCILYIRFMKKKQQIYTGFMRNYINWVINYYQPQNKFQSPLNPEWLKPYQKEHSNQIRVIISQSPEVHIPDNIKNVVARLIWKRMGEPDGKEKEHWKASENILRKYWFWSRNLHQEEELQSYGPVYTKINRMVTEAVRQVDPKYQRMKKTQAIQAYQFYQRQIARIQKELES